MLFARSVLPQALLNWKWQIIKIKNRLLEPSKKRVIVLGNIVSSNHRGHREKLCSPLFSFPALCSLWLFISLPVSKCINKMKNN